MNKKEKERLLIEDDINTIESGEIAYLADLLREGFKGYSKYTIKEINQEFKDRFDFNLS